MGFYRTLLACRIKNVCITVCLYAKHNDHQQAQIYISPVGNMKDLTSMYKVSAGHVQSICNIPSTKKKEKKIAICLLYWQEQSLIGPH